MSQHLIDLKEAINLIALARQKCHGDSSFGWNKTYSAGDYLEKQVKAYFAPEEVAA